MHNFRIQSTSGLPALSPFFWLRSTFPSSFIYTLLRWSCVLQLDWPEISSALCKILANSTRTHTHTHNMSYILLPCACPWLRNSSLLSEPCIENVPNANTNPKSLHCELTDRANEIAILVTRVREREREKGERECFARSFCLLICQCPQIFAQPKTVCPGRVLRTVSVFYSTFLWLFHPRLCIHSTSPPFTLPLPLDYLSVCLSVRPSVWLVAVATGPGYVIPRHRLKQS